VVVIALNAARIAMAIVSTRLVELNLHDGLHSCQTAQQLLLYSAGGETRLKAAETEVRLVDALEFGLCLTKVAQCFPLFVLESLVVRFLRAW